MLNFNDLKKIFTGTDGKAGMATVEDEEGQLDFNEFYLGAVKVLPSYARPIFVRIVKKMDMTGILF